MMMIPLSSTQMKSAIMLDLIVLRAWFILIMCILESLMNLLARSLFIRIITCFQEGSLVVISILGFSLLFVLLMIFWTKLIFLFGRLKNVFLSFKVFIAIFDIEVKLDCLEEDDAYTYDFSWGVLTFFLKYFDNSLTSFYDLAEISGKSDDMKVGFTVSFPLLLAEVLGIWELNLDLILFLNNVLELST